MVRSLRLQLLAICPFVVFSSAYAQDGLQTIKFDDACIQRVHGSGFSAVLLAYNPSGLGVDPVPSVTGAHYSIVNTTIYLPALAQRFPQLGDAQEPEVVFMLDRSDPPERDSDAPEYLLAFSNATLEEMIQRSNSTDRDLTCLYRTSSGAVSSAPFEWKPTSDTESGDCTIKVADLKADQTVTTLRVVLQSKNDGIAYYIADYPYRFPQEFGDKLMQAQRKTFNYARTTGGC